MELSNKFVSPRMTPGLLQANDAGMLLRLAWMIWYGAI
jgi:hypothetical protein